MQKSVASFREIFGRSTRRKKQRQPNRGETEPPPLGAEQLYQIVPAPAEDPVVLKCDVYIKLTDDVFYGAKVYRAQDLPNIGDNHMLAILLNFGKDLHPKSARYSAIINALKPNDATLIYPKADKQYLSKCYLMIGPKDVSYFVTTKYHMTLACFGARFRLVFIISSKSQENKVKKDILYAHIFQWAYQQIKFNQSTRQNEIIGLNSKRLPIVYRNGQKDEMLLLFKNEPNVELALTFDIAQIYKRVACESALRLNGNVLGNEKVGGYFNALQQYGRYVRNNNLITRWSDPGGANVEFTHTSVFFSNMPGWYRVLGLAVPQVSTSYTDRRFVIQYDDSGSPYNYAPPYMFPYGMQRVVNNNAFVAELKGFAFIYPEDVHFFKFTQLPKHYGITVYIYKMPGNYIHLETTDQPYFEFLKEYFVKWLDPEPILLDLTQGLIGKLLNLNRNQNDPIIDRNLLDGLMHSAARGQIPSDVLMCFPLYGTLSRRMEAPRIAYQETCLLIANDVKQTMQQALTRLAMVLVENEADKWLPALQVARDRTRSRCVWQYYFHLGMNAIKRFSTNALRYWSETGHSADKQTFLSLKPQYRLQFSDYEAPF